MGVLFIPRNLSDIKSNLKQGPDSEFIYALTPELFTAESLKALTEHSSKVAGVVVLDSKNGTRPVSMSPASTCPNHISGLYAKNDQYKDYCPVMKHWNPEGNEFLFHNFQFPMFVVDDEVDIKAIKKCFASHNLGLLSHEMIWPLCSLRLKANMIGTTNTEVCRRRSLLSQYSLKPLDFCSPIADYNILAPLNPISEKLENSSVILVVARTDAASMFDNVSPGANSATTGLVTLMAVADALSSTAVKQSLKDANRHVVFLMLEGETWDYIGSNAMAYKMNNKSFPFIPATDQEDHISNIDFSHINHFIELSQLGLQKTSATKAYMHTDPISSSDPSINDMNKLFQEAMMKSGEKFDVTMVPPTSDDIPLPPASLQTFLKYYNISGTVITDNPLQYRNNFYQSIWDDHINVGLVADMDGVLPGDELHKHLTKIASTVATAVFNVATGGLCFYFFYS